MQVYGAIVIQVKNTQGQHCAITAYWMPEGLMPGKWRVMGTVDVYVYWDRQELIDLWARNFDIDKVELAKKMEEVERCSR